MNTAIIVIIMAIYMAAMLYIGYRGSKYSTNLTDFLTAGKQGKLYMVAGSFLGAHVGTGIVVGGATNGAKYGIGAGWYGIGAALSFILFGIFCAKWAYSNNYLTIPAYFRDRYKTAGKGITLVWSVLSVAVALSTLSGQVIAGKNLFAYMGIQPFVGCVLSMAIIYLYCSAAGMWGVMMTDFWQCIVILVGLVAAIFAIFTNSDAAAVISTLEPSYFEPVPFDTKTLLLMVLPTAVYGLTGGANMQRTASADSLKTATRAPIIGGILVALFTFLPVTLGMYGMAAYENADPSTIIYQVIVTELGPVMAGLMLAAIVAAVMSTCDTTIMTIVTSVVYDAYGNVLAPKYNLPVDEKTKKRASNILTIGLCVLAVFGAFVSNDIISMLATGYTMFAAGGLVPYIFARCWKKGTSQAAVASMIVGMAVALANSLGIIKLVTGLLCVIPAAIVYVVVTLITQPKEEAAAK